MNITKEEAELLDKYFTAAAFLSNLGYNMSQNPENKVKDFPVKMRVQEFDGSRNKAFAVINKIRRAAAK